MRKFSALLLLCLLPSLCEAQLFRRRGRVTPSYEPVGAPAKPYTGTATSCKDALAEVNAARAARGLKPFLPDPLLTQAAYAAATYRAANLINGHVPGIRGDFQFLPKGADSHTAGCGGLEPSWGWGACGTYGDYTHAGAAWVMGRDGKRYMHQFLR